MIIYIVAVYFSRDFYYWFYIDYLDLLIAEEAIISNNKAIIPVHKDKDG